MGTNSNPVGAEMKLILATHNRHKVSELSAMLPESFTLMSLDDIGFNEEIEETGSTFEDNAGIKSSLIYQKFRVPCIADDSGLQIDALNGEPGVYSARYAGEAASDINNCALVLGNMKGKTNRSARFVSVISFRWEGNEKLFRGELEGTITQEPKGSQGFGYDPIFIPDGYAITLAEMQPEEKNAISHRAKAIQQLVTYLKLI
ncbi:MAG: RdgB/HAM1 family non-canonical purine NTP pyrophosphatase [Bacteroidia bacterium]